jgi:hypothetical protein
MAGGPPFFVPDELSECYIAKLAPVSRDWFVLPPIDSFIGASRFVGGAGMHFAGCARPIDHSTFGI